MSILLCHKPRTFTKLHTAINTDVLLVDHGLSFWTCVCVCVLCVRRDMTVSVNHIEDRACGAVLRMSGPPADTRTGC